MTFTLLVAGDHNGEKHNIELPFPAQPASVADVSDGISQSFTAEFKQPFAVERLQFFDANAGGWREVQDVYQLRPYTQLYAVASNSAHTDQSKPIPAPRRAKHPPTAAGTAVAAAPVPVQAVATMRTTSGMAGMTLSGSNSFPIDPTADVKIRAVFQEMATDGSIKKDDWMRRFNALEMPFSVATTNDLFARADADGDDEINTSDFKSFADIYPVTLDALYTRIRLDHETIRREKLVDEHRLLIDELHRRERSAMVQLKAAAEELKVAHNQIGSHEQDVAGREADEETLHEQNRNISDQIITAQTELKRRGNTLEKAKDNARSTFLAVDTVREKLVDARHNLSCTDEAVVAQQDIVRELEAQLTDAKRILANNREELSIAEDHVEEVKTDEREILIVHEQTQRELTPLENAVTNANKELRAWMDKELSVQNSITKAERQTKTAEQLLEAAKRPIDELQARAQEAKALQMEAAEALDDGRVGMRQLEQDVEDVRVHRKEEEVEEIYMMEEEVRLCEQRFNLNERESTHHGAKARYLSPRNERAMYSTQVLDSSVNATGSVRY